MARFGVRARDASWCFQVQNRQILYLDRPLPEMPPIRVDNGVRVRVRVSVTFGFVASLRIKCLCLAATNAVL